MRYSCSLLWGAAVVIVPIAFTLPADSSPHPHNLDPHRLELAQTAQPLPSTLLPRFTGNLETGLGAAYGHSQWGIQGFIPFAQTPESHTFFTEARWFGFSEDQWGGNLRLGYREYLPTADLVWGGYVGYDLRRTRFKQTFHQLGFGADLQGSQWGARFNGYLPVGDRRRQVAEDQVTTTENQATNLRFQGERLLYDLLRQQTLTTTRQFETSAAGWDLEAGHILLDGEMGRLSGHLGTYLLNIPRKGRYLGVRGRLVKELGDRLTASVALSQDGNFGTNLSLSVGVLLGGRSPSEADPASSVLARLGRGVERQEAIALDHQREVIETISRDRLNDQIARNPATGDLWRFIHVTGGAVGGEGTVENPFGEVTAGVAIAQSAGNDVIYVDAGTNPGLAGFIIPDRVRVLSTGVVQSLDLADVGQVQLPGSGTGTLPRLQGSLINSGGFNGQVGMGNHSQLSGFNVITTGDNQRGILGVNVSGATIDRNQITTQGNGAHGISFDANVGGTVSNTIITGNTITTSGINAEGMYLRANDGTIRDTTITGNTISTSAFYGDGIFLRANEGILSGAIVANNIVTTAGGAARAIFISTQDSSLLNNVTVTGNTVTTTGNDRASGIYLRSSSSGVLRDVTVVGNTVTTTGNALTHGIFVHSNANGILGDVAVEGNRISTAGTEAQGIFVFSNNGELLTNVGITNNLIQQAGQHSVFVETNDAAGNLCIAAFTGNRSNNPGVSGAGDDLNVAVFGGSTVNFVGFSNVGANNTGFGAISGTPTGQPPSCP